MFSLFSRKKIIFASLAVMAGIFFLTVLPVSAQQECQQQCDTKLKTKSAWNLMYGVSDSCFCCGDCNICDFLSIFTQAARLILMSVGGVALIMLLWSGIGLIFNW